MKRHGGDKRKREYCTDLLSIIQSLLEKKKKILSAFVKFAKLLFNCNLHNKYYIRTYLT